MKRAKRREPYQSAISDERRRELVERARSRELTDDETEEMLADNERAIAKRIAALEEKAHAGDSGFVGLFENPDRSAASAGASVEVTLWPIKLLARDGAKARRGWRKAGIGRHDPDNDPETAARHNTWRQARNAILSEMRAEGQRKPGRRRLAALICARVENSNFETVRGWLRREASKGKASR